MEDLSFDLAEFLDMSGEDLSAVARVAYHQRLTASGGSSTLMGPVDSTDHEADVAMHAAAVVTSASACVTGAEHPAAGFHHAGLGGYGPYTSSSGGGGGQQRFQPQHMLPTAFPGGATVTLTAGPAAVSAAEPAPFGALPPRQHQPQQPQPQPPTPSPSPVPVPGAGFRVKAEKRRSTSRAGRAGRRTRPRKDLAPPMDEVLEAVIPKTRMPDFNVFQLTVDGLKEELRLRGDTITGSKKVLCERLLKSVAGTGGVSARLAPTVDKKRKKPHTRKQPQRADYADEASYNEAWAKWRANRDHNNRSVKRSRENAKLKTTTHQQLVFQRDVEMRNLSKQLLDHRHQVKVLLQHIRGLDLSKSDALLLQDLLDNDALLESD